MSPLSSNPTCESSRKDVFRFLELPAELRNKVYGHFTPADIYRTEIRGLLLSCRQIYHESRSEIAFQHRRHLDKIKQDWNRHFDAPLLIYQFLESEQLTVAFPIFYFLDPSVDIHIGQDNLRRRRFRQSLKSFCALNLASLGISVYLNSGYDANHAAIGYINSQQPTYLYNRISVLVSEIRSFLGDSRYPVTHTTIRPKKVTLNLAVLQQLLPRDLLTACVLAIEESHFVRRTRAGIAQHWRVELQSGNGSSVRTSIDDLYRRNSNRLGTQVFQYFPIPVNVVWTRMERTCGEGHVAGHILRVLSGPYRPGEIICAHWEPE
jgi:hypothetical protein